MCLCGTIEKLKKATGRSLCFKRKKQYHSVENRTWATEGLMRRERERFPEPRPIGMDKSRRAAQPLDTGSQDETGLIFITTGDLW